MEITIRRDAKIPPIAAPQGQENHATRPISA
jgi:hypothetical protein